MKKCVFIFVILLHLTLRGRAPGSTVLPFGNFALPTSQRPTALFGFGQGFVDADDLLLIATPLLWKGCHKSYTEFIPSVLYGISERLYATLSVPFAIRLQEERCCSKGLEDIAGQLEYLIYEEGDHSVSRYISLVGIGSLPTGKSEATPLVGRGSPFYTLGFTAGSLSWQWYLFTSAAYTITTQHLGHKIGNSLLYQVGIGRNIDYRTDQWMLTAIIEFDGIYQQHNRINNCSLASTGSNKGFIAPSLWFATQHLSLQLGVGVVLYQQYNSPQLQDSYFLQGSVAWKF